MDRRGFLSGILAAGMAPAIVRAESLMKIFVPKREIILDIYPQILFPGEIGKIDGGMRFITKPCIGSGEYFIFLHPDAACDWLKT